MSAPNSPQGGFSMVSVLVIMGVVLTSILLMSQARFRQQGTQKALKIKQSYTDVNQALINDIVATFHQNLAGASCLDYPSNFNSKKLDDKVTYSFVTANTGVSANAPQIHKDAANRCRSAVRPPNGNSGNRFYFCVKLSQDQNAPTDSILNAKVAFAEFAVELIDLQTQQAITCNQYVTRRADPKDGSEGMAVTMALYWENTSGPGGSTFSQKALSYIANQN